MEKFLNCRAAIAQGYSEISVQFNRATDKANNLWYKSIADFDDTAWIVKTDIATKDSLSQSSKRLGVEVETFKETADITIKEDRAAPFLKELHACSLYGDQYKTDMFDHGLNVKVVNYGANGTYTTKIYYCCTIVSFNDPFAQKATSESQVDLSIVLNNEPVVYNVGYISALPTGFEDIKITAVHTPTATTISSLITVVSDANALLVTDPKNFIVDVYNKKTGLLVTSGTGTKAVAIVTTVPKGDYIVVVGYLVLKDGLLFNYKNIDAQEITVA